uniref:Ig-like domain-containing protein n=1 Tax=Sinocyclocheilus rhinocerous TaxID=307959 RepID=A0A673NLN4_9TELE
MIFVMIVICLSTVFISVGQTSVHIVLQSTRFISALPGDKVTFDCSMAAGVSVSSYTMHWYRQDHYGQPIQFIIKEYDKTTQNYEAILNTKDNMFSLIVSNLTAEDSSTYYCAASHSEARTVHALTITYFGNGTKLTVLAANVTLPKVKILPPSPKEICSQDKINDKRSTLVCVASGFYPDHVSVSWKVNGVARQDSVSTDTSAQQDKTTLMYHISSRIKVNDTDWMDLKSSFACTVQFFNGDEYVNVTNTINGQKGL